MQYYIHIFSLDYLVLRVPLTLNILLGIASVWQLSDVALTTCLYPFRGLHIKNAPG